MALICVLCVSIYVLHQPGTAYQSCQDKTENKCSSRRKVVAKASHITLLWCRRLICACILDLPDIPVMAECFASMNYFILLTQLQLEKYFYPNLVDRDARPKEVVHNCLQGVTGNHWQSQELIPDFLTSSPVCEPQDHSPSTSLFQMDWLLLTLKFITKPPLAVESSSDQDTRIT